VGGKGRYTGIFWFPGLARKDRVEEKIGDLRLLALNTFRNAADTTRLEPIRLDSRVQEAPEDWKAELGKMRQTIIRR
jgi:hypothetical protein